MKKLVLVINGCGGVGKDTLCDMAAKHYRVRNVSSVTPIKELAAQCGWNGEKDDRARRILSDLKALTAAYNDFPTKWLCDQYTAFEKTDEELMFVHIREGAEIEKFVSLTGGGAKTLLIRGGERMRKKCEAGYGNASDDRVEDYGYDYYFTNDLPLEETEQVFIAFLEEIFAL